MIAAADLLADTGSRTPLRSRTRSQTRYQDYEFCTTDRTTGGMTVLVAIALAGGAQQ